MSSLLRHPGIVPSLFSDGIDGVARRPDDTSLSRRAVALMTLSLSALRTGRINGLRQKDSAIAASGLILALCFKPLIH